MTEKNGLQRWLSPLRILGILAGLLAVVVIVLGILYGVERNKNHSTVENDEFCLTPSCIKAGRLCV